MASIWVVALKSSTDRRLEVAAPAVAKLSGAALRFGQREEFVEALDAELGVDDEQLRPADQQRHRREVAAGVVRRVAEDVRVGDETVEHRQQRVAVGRRLGHGVGADDAAGAGAIVDDYRLAEHFRELRRDRARDDVGDAARRRRHDHADRFGRVILRHCGRAGHGGERRP